jgi:hypothetical protein
MRGKFMANRRLAVPKLASRLRVIVATGARYYFALMILQFVMGLLFGGGLILLGYDFADAQALLRRFE